MLAESVAKALDRKVTNARVAVVRELSDHRQGRLLVAKQFFEHRCIVVVSQGHERAHGAIWTLRDSGSHRGDLVGGER